jgi:hypothetical protein
MISISEGAYFRFVRNTSNVDAKRGLEIPPHCSAIPVAAKAKFHQCEWIRVNFAHRFRCFRNSSPLIRRQLEIRNLREASRVMAIGS